MAESTEREEEFLKCSLCFEYDELKRLPCHPGHICCVKCLTEVTKVVQCSLCRSVFDDEIGSLPSAGEPLDKFLCCDVCMRKEDKRELAQIYCIICRKKFCTTHEKAHNESLDDHAGLRMDEYEKEFRKLETRYCQTHTDELYNIGCERCHNVYCKVCNFLQKIGTCTDGSTHKLSRLDTLVAKLIERAERRRQKAAAKFAMSINPPTGVKTRLSLRELELAENSQKKNDFLKALKIVKELPADNPSSFWSIASYHGMPYKKRQVPPYQIPPNYEGNAAWDGYCQHGNVLFPTWHRFYCLKLEQSLQAAVPGGDVMLPYWDQTSEANMASGLPPLLLEKTITIDGVSGIPNPLLNFTLPEAITEPAEADNHDANAKYYVKPKGYTTVRYPFSGISNPTAAKDTADKHNQYIDGLNTDPDTMLAANVRYWLTKGGVGVNIGTYNSISDEYKKALEVSSYNKFSNTSSSAGSQFCLEQAHNEIHLSVGGFSQPFVQEDGSVKVDDDGNIMYFGLIGGANGDMGENETAAFDPCFFMHHCNVDRMFWVWQKKWGHTTSIPLEESSSDTGLTNAGQGPTPYQTPGQQLNFQTALHPYTNVSTGALMTSSDCFNIEKLGYEYSIGSLDQETWSASATTHKFVELEGKSWKDVVPKLENAVQAAKKPLVVSFDSTHFAPATPESPIVPLQYNLTDKGEDEPAFVKLGRDRFRVRNYLSVKNINKNSVDGSFLVQAFYKKADKLHYIGQRGVLSRWSQEVCGNCMQHPNMAVCFAVNHILPNLKDLSNVVIIIASKDPQTGKVIQTRVVQGEPVVFAAGKGSFKPTFHLITSCEQELLGAMEQQAVA